MVGSRAVTPDDVFLGLSASIVSITKENYKEFYSYGVLLDNGVDQWTLHKRYSDFRRFRRALLAMTRRCQCQCRFLYLPLSTVAFPKRTLFTWRHAAERTAVERQRRLAQFVSVLLCLLQPSTHAQTCDFAACAVLNLIIKFLHIVPRTTMELHGHRAPPPRMLWPATARRQKPPIYTIRENDIVVGSPASTRLEWY
ncbi:hypothetical protein ACHHYP_20457 [Achlya hypogyna]|uniref:PX domain-containing protein n=1 Tax=Achlya hypogyna TaxID=1202772 RepID=A0A1V9ZIR7_ACHHY|nr:hypothetical protein ACHHYP_20457 [Achlya hypogyna]